MFAVVSMEDLRKVHMKGQPIGVFLATGFEQDVVQWVWDCWADLNNVTGPHWHLLMPSRVDSFELNENKADSIRLLNRELVDEANAIYQIDRKEFPAIVFDSFDDNRRQPYLRLPESPTGLNLRDMFLDLTNAIKDAQQTRFPNTPMGARQAEMMEAIVHGIKNRRRIRHLLGFAPFAASFALRLLPRID